MTRKPLVMLLFSLVFYAGCGGNGGGVEETVSLTPEQLDEVFQQSYEKYQAVETVDEKLLIVKEFLKEHPESKYTGDVLNRTVNIMVWELDDSDGAIAYALEIRSKVKDPEILVAVDKQLLNLYGNAKRIDDVRDLATRLEEQGSLIYTDHLAVIEYAIDSEAWDLVLDHCAFAEPFANAETFRADYPNEDYSDEEIEIAGRNRVGLLLTYDGWAKVNTGEVDDGLSEFAEAEGLLRRSYFGFPANELYHYWGTALLDDGDARGAIDKLASAALFGGQEEAMEPLKQAYLATGGSESGFDEFVWAQRLKLAKTVDDFTLSDYDGQPRSFAELRGKVTLLNFWHPT